MANASFGELVLKFTADIAQLLASTERIKKEVSGLASSVTESINGIKSTVLLVGEAFLVFEGVKFFGDIIQNSIEAQASLELLSQKTGLTVEQLSALSNTAASVGINLDESSNLIFKFEKNINDAASGTGRAADALRSLGFSSKDLAGFLNDPNAALVTVSQRLADYRDGIGKTTAEMDLFGRSGAQLAPLLKIIGEEGLKAATVTTEMAQRAEEQSRAWNSLKNDIQQFINQAVGQALPSFQALIQVVGQFIADIFGLKGGIKELIETGQIGAWAQQAAFSIAGFLDLVSSFGTRIKEGGKVLEEFGLVLLDVGRIATGALQVLSGDFSAGIANIKAGWGDLKNDAGDLAKAYSEPFKLSTQYTDALASSLLRAQVPLNDFSEKHEKAALSVNRLNDSMAKVTAATNAYEKALAGVAKAGEDALAALAEQGLKDRASETKRLYDQGVIDFQDYYNRLEAIEEEGLRIQANQLSAQLEIQKGLVAGLQQAVNNIDPSKFKTSADYIVAVTKAETDLLNAYKVEVDIDGKLAVVRDRQSQVGQDYIEKYLIPANRLILESIPALQQKIDQQQLENDTIGLTAAQIQLEIAARDQNLLRIELETKARPEVIAFLQREIEMRQQLSAVLQRGEDIRAQISAWQDVMHEVETVFTNILTKGKDTWQQLTQWLKDTLIKELFKLVATKWIIPLIVDITGNQNLGAALANQLGPSFLSSLFGGGGGGGFNIGNLFSSGASSFALSGAGSALGLSTVGTTAATDAAFAGTLGGIEELGAGAASTGAVLTEFGAGLTAAASFLPYVGVALIAAQALGLFSHEPSQVQGQFGIRGAGTEGSTFEDQAYINTKFGKLMVGFLDSGTQYFSGDAAKVFDKIVGDSIDAFSTRFSGEQADHFAETLKNMTFQAFSGTYTTEDFIQKYGGQVLQQVVTAAFQELDPALAAVAANFSGTADQVAQFSNTLLSIYDATANLPTTVKANIESALDSTQETADKVLAFVVVLNSLQGPLDGLHTSFLQLSGTDIPALVDAMGGVQAFTQSQAYLFQNFTTSADKMSLAQQALTNGFNQLGLTTDDLARAGLTTFPRTHAEFLQLLSSFDLTTEHGRELYASVIALAPAFVQVHGTADDAAQAVQTAADAITQLTDAAHNLSGSDLANAQSFFNQNFLSASEQRAQAVAADMDKVNNTFAAFGDQLHNLGYDAIPTTTEGFRQLVDKVKDTYGADSDLYKALLLLAPAIVDLGKDAKTAATAIADAGNTIANTAAGLSAGDITNLATKFVSKFISSIDAINSQNTGDLGAKLGLKSGLIADEIATLQAQLASRIASTGIFDTVTEQYQDEIDQLTNINKGIANDLAQFTVLKAQYGSDIAEQLVNLQDWYDQQSRALRGNVDALAALQTIFADKWKSIIEGTSTGVGGATDALGKLVQSIRDFIKQLTTSDLSPLTPLQKLAEAQKQYNDELAKAQTGDQAALGDITKFAQAYLQQSRAVYASSAAYTDIFNAVVGGLTGLTNLTSGGSDIINPSAPPTSTTLLPPGYGSAGFGDTGGTSPHPNALASPSTTALSALTNAVPTDGKLASSTDSAALGTKLDRLSAEMSDVRDAVVALAGVHEHVARKQVQAIDKNAQTIVANTTRKRK